MTLTLIIENCKSSTYKQSYGKLWAMLSQWEKKYPSNKDCPTPFFDEYCIWFCGSLNNDFHKFVVQQVMDSSLKMENIFIISFRSSIGNSPFLHHALTQYRGDVAHHLETCSISVI